MREIVFDTETTGLDNQADRIIEIGCIELEPGDRCICSSIRMAARYIPTPWRCTA